MTVRGWPGYGGSVETKYFFLETYRFFETRQQLCCVTVTVWPRTGGFVETKREFFLIPTHLPTHPPTYLPSFSFRFRGPGVGERPLGGWSVGGHFVETKR